LIDAILKDRNYVGSSISNKRLNVICEKAEVLIKDIDLNEMREDEKLFKEVYYPYLSVKGVVDKSTVLSRGSVFDFGVTTDPAERFADRKSRHRYGSDVRMLILMKCSDENLPTKVQTPFLFGRTIEHMIALSDFPKLSPDAKAGDGTASEKNAARLASIMHNLQNSTELLIDAALKDRKYVTSKDNAGVYECNKCKKKFDTRGKSTPVNDRTKQSFDV